MIFHPGVFFTKEITKGITTQSDPFCDLKIFIFLQGMKRQDSSS